MSVTASMQYNTNSTLIYTHTLSPFRPFKAITNTCFTCFIQATAYFLFTATDTYQTYSGTKHFVHAPFGKNIGRITDRFLCTLICSYLWVT